MTFSKYSQYLQKLENTDSRLEMTSILEKMFKSASGKEIAILCYLSLGSLGPLFDNKEFNIAGKTMIKAIGRAYNIEETKITQMFKEVGDLGEVTYSIASANRNINNLSVTEIYQTLLKIANDKGAGSQERKLRQTATLLASQDRLSAKYLTRIILGTLRLGFSELTILDALSQLIAGDKSLRSDIEQAYNVHPDIGYIAQVVAGTWHSPALQVETGIPIKPQLCQRVNEPSEILERHKGSTIAEPKIDGTRVQLHLCKNSADSACRNSSQAIRSGVPGVDFTSNTIRATSASEESRTSSKIGFSTRGNPRSKNTNVTLFSESEDTFIAAFTRNLERVDYQFPDIIAKAKKLPAQSFVLDGEAIGINLKTGKFLPFQETITRKRKHGVEEAVKEVTLIYIVFDLLYLNGASLINKPFAERREQLLKLVKQHKVSRSTQAGDIVVGEARAVTKENELIKYFNEYTASGGEGLVCKDRNAEYRAGGRGYSWIKLKNLKDSDLSDTMDLLIMGVYKGRGKRAAFGAGAFLVGVLDVNNDVYKTVAKIGTGLSDEEWMKVSELGKKLPAKSKPVNYQVNDNLIPDVWVSPKVVVSVRADNITTSPLHSAGKALRFPRLMAWRTDKGPKDVTTLNELNSIS